MPTSPIRILFIINPGAGAEKTDWTELIREFFADKPNYAIELFELPQPCAPAIIKKKITDTAPSLVVAAGGDGTIKLVAECLQHSDIPMGIIPGGSANGMAKELGIDKDNALQVLVEGVEKTIHLVKVNDELCIHLSDIGFNAFVVKKFEEANTRGMWGYVKAAFKVLWQHRKMIVRVQTDKEEVVCSAAMVVIANATMYGNGVVINPEGSLYDELFEVILIRKISLKEIFKMRFTQKGFDPSKTEFFQTRHLSIASKHRAHFQVDGEIIGKVKKVEASIIKNALKIICPQEPGKVQSSTETMP
jgi:diacylglycerol kinase (ATP)